MQRSDDFDLRAEIRSVSFTARVADLPRVFDLLGGTDEEDAEAAERALLRVGRPAIVAALDRLRAGGASPPRSPLRGRLARLVGRFAQASGEAEWVDPLLGLLTDEDPKTRRNAIGALGKLRGARQGEIESALLEAWRREERIDHRRSLAVSLGKVGAARALGLLENVRADDAELRRLVDEAVLLLRRNLSAAETFSLDEGGVAAVPLVAVARCRRGLESILAGELEAWAPAITGPGRVNLHFAGRLDAIFRARTWLGFGFALPREPVAADGDRASALARALTSPLARSVIGAFTRGTPRYRIEWTGGGKQRSLVWRAVQAVSARWPELVNDPSRRAWEVVVREEEGALAVELSPRLADPRFAYRRGDVAAASHPTLAAALARVAGVRADDVVWDPFVGSGSELVERARLGPVARLLGSDRDPAALAVARTNLAAAGVDAELIEADARTFSPRGVTLILTNPPMGRRLLRDEDLGALLDAFVDHAARVLRRGGRLVWISPHGERTAARAARAGLALREERLVDMGGFTAALQVLLAR